jgi:hypothetical protein
MTILVTPIIGINANGAQILIWGGYRDQIVGEICEMALRVYPAHTSAASKQRGTQGSGSKTLHHSYLPIHRNNARLCTPKAWNAIQIQRAPHG